MKINTFDTCHLANVLWCVYFAGGNVAGHPRTDSLAREACFAGTCKTAQEGGGGGGSYWGVLCCCVGGVEAILLQSLRRTTYCCHAVTEKMTFDVVFSCTLVVVTVHDAMSPSCALAAYSWPWPCCYTEYPNYTGAMTDM